jgi:hypothetical protein
MMLFNCLDVESSYVLQRFSYMVSFGTSRHFFIKLQQCLVKETKLKPLQKLPNALYTMLAAGIIYLKLFSF